VLTFTVRVWYYIGEVMGMKRLCDRIFGCPFFYRELLFAARYGAVVQFVSAFFFLRLSRSGGPLGCLEAALVMSEAAVATATVAVCIGLTAHFLRKCGMKF